MWVCEQMYMPSCVCTARQALHKCSCVCVCVGGLLRGCEMDNFQFEWKHIQLGGGHAAYSLLFPHLLRSCMVQ